MEGNRHSRRGDRGRMSQPQAFETHEFVVALPTKRTGQAVSFTAYAFNKATG